MPGLAGQNAGAGAGLRACSACGQRSWLSTASRMAEASACDSLPLLAGVAAHSSRARLTLLNLG